MSTLSIARRGLTALETLHSGLTRDSLTAEARHRLAGWCGWGPLAKAFDAHADPEWAEIADRLTDLFTHAPAELTAAAEHVDTSFYTPTPIIAEMFTLLRASGFTTGSVLEPGCGSGRFMAHTPADMSLSWTGVESDPTSAAIAALLNPDATIIAKPLQKVSLVTGSFDAAIGNVPFSKTSVYDPTYESGPLHEYFLRRALDAVHPGGFVAAVTSRYTMDTAGVLARIQSTADLIAAVRLPTGAFADEGTSVVTDVLLLRRRGDVERISGWDDAAEHAGPITRDYYRREVHGARRTCLITGPAKDPRFVPRVEVNRYWEVHPDHVAGEMQATGFDRSPLRVVSDAPERAVPAVFAAARELVPAYTARPIVPPAEQLFADVTLTDPDGRPEGSFHLLDDGAVQQVTGGVLQPVPRAGEELKTLIRLREAAEQLLALESDPDLPDTAITRTRTRTLGLYTDYVARFGALNRGVLHEGRPDPDTGAATLTWRRPAMGGFRRDPGYVTVLALESFDQDTGDAQPAPILLRRVNHRVDPVERVNSPADAVAVCLGEGRGLDLDRIAGLLGLATRRKAATAIADLLFRDPATGQDVLSWEYLSGDVRAKLAAARAAADTDATYRRNVAALERALPADLGPTDIRASLGAPWIPSEDVSTFLRDVLESHHRVTFTPTVAVWEVESRKWSRVSPAIAMQWGTRRVDPLTLVEHVLNGKQPVVYDTEWENGRERKVRNQAETLAATEKAAALAERFSVWVWEDADRAQRLCAEYNRRFNSHVQRRYDGSRLTFPGLADSVRLWDWQRDGVARILASPRTLIGHAVGAGKTLTAICSAVNLRRLGLANKPLITVPNHLLEQIAREAQQAYPTGKFLIAAKEDLTGDARRLFAARCATGDFDAIVLTHQAFGSLSVSPDVEEAWLQQQKAAYREILTDQRSGRGAKAVASMLRTFDKRIAELRDTRTDPNQVLFDHLGIDFIAVDEFHLYKRLSVPTAGMGREDGFSMGASKRATDLLLKIDTLAQRYPGKPIMAGFTGTPWSNTLAETFIWQCYLQPDRLAAADVSSFAAWAATFVSWETTVEVAPDGSGFRLARRPSTMQNVPELRAMLDAVADLLPADALNLARPDCRVHNVAVKPGERQLAAVAALAARADRLRGGAVTLPDGRQDNMLLICGDGRQLALDPQLRGVDEPSPKLAAAAEQIARIYHDNIDTRFGDSPVTGVLQLAFCDQGTPHPGDARSYGRLRAALVKHGVPATAIRFVHEAKTDKARAALFAACRSGDVAVLLGSTEKLGIGTNVQRRLRALHHIDAPWRPSDIEQRDGRGNRPGNLNPEIDVYRYVTERTFDSFLWQTLERKARFIAQLFRTRVTERDLDDIGDVVLSYGEVKALAAGNPRLLEQATLAVTVKRLRVLRAVHIQSVTSARQEAKQLTENASADARTAETCEAAAAIVAANPAGSSDVSMLEVFASQIRSRRPARAIWRGVELSADTGPRDSWDKPKRLPPLPPMIDVTVQVRYRPVATFSLPRLALRAGDSAAAGALQDLLDDAVRALPHRAASLRERAADRLRMAGDAEAAADRAVFPHEGELNAAVARLARVTAEIEAVAGESDVSSAA